MVRRQSGFDPSACGSAPGRLSDVSAPKFVPLTSIGAFRGGEELPPALSWMADRPAEIEGSAPTGKQMGRPGPDQGYALTLARLFHGKLRLADGEHERDVVAGCLGVALKRAALFGRAPVVHDLDLAFAVFGFTGTADTPTELKELRTKLFEAASHHYDLQRAIADAVPDATLRMTPDQVKTSLVANWRSLLAHAV